MALQDLLNTRAVTPLLRDAKLIDEDEAEIRLAEVFFVCMQMNLDAISVCNPLEMASSCISTI